MGEPSPRVSTDTLYGCRVCGTFAYSPPIVHRPGSHCDPGSYEAMENVPPALSRERSRREQLEAAVEEGLTGLMAAVYALSPAQPPTKTQWDDLAVGLARARSLLEGETLDG